MSRLRLFVIVAAAWGGLVSFSFGQQQGELPAPRGVSEPVTGSTHNARLWLGKPVVAIGRDGRKLRGIVDSKTNASELWLASQAEGITLRSRISWSNIVRLDDPTAHDARRITLVGEPLPATVRGPTREAAVRSLSIRAVPANWDDDPETDGFRVFIAPLSRSGDVVPASGQLTVRLMVRQDTLVRDRQPLREAESVSQRVSPEQFGRDGLVVELPLRRLRLEQADDWAVDARVEARLSVAGQGVFEGHDPHAGSRCLELVRFGHRLPPAVRWFPGAAPAGP